ncbi:MAG: hypothetical protein ABUL64_02800 [Singulisphaera sp.]
MSSNGSNKWNVGWGGIKFFEQVLSNHSSVASFERVNDIQFLIRRKAHPDVNAVLVDDYMLGEATLYAIMQEFPGTTAVVNNGTWNHIAFDWREVARRTGVVALLMADFLGAINVPDLTQYTPRDEREERSRGFRKSS